MEAHSSKRLECRKCGTKFVHQKSYDQHQRAMCMGHRKRIAARKLQLPAMNPETHTRKSFVCKYCAREYNFIRTMEIHIQQNHPEHEGETSDAYTVQGLDDVNQNGGNSTLAINIKKESVSEEEKTESHSMETCDKNRDIDTKTTSVELGQNSNDFPKSVKLENGDEDLAESKGIRKLDGDNYTNYLVKNFLINDKAENV